MKKAYAQFKDILADTSKRDIQSIFLQVSVFALAFDGSHPRKTGTEEASLRQVCYSWESS